MKALEINDYGLVGVLARSFAGATASEAGRADGRNPCGPSDAGRIKPDGLLGRLTRWFWRQKRHGVEAELARSRDVFESLDRWLWKQQMRETEAWLGQSKDVFELEARIRRLERGPSRL